MELLKLDERPAEFKWQDVTFFYRTKVTVGDKFAVDTAGAIISGDKVEFSPWSFYQTMIKVFVTGWKGVTENGKEVAYTYLTMLDRLPSDTVQDLIMKLGLQIAQDTGFLTTKEHEERKNGSGVQSNG